MADRHLDDDLLVELAVDTLPQDDEAAALRHLAGCPSCRARYDEQAATLDAALAASPEVAPPAGFEARVLEALPDGGAAAAPPRRRSRLPVLVAAAAAVVLLLIGGVAGVVLDRALTSSGGGSGSAWTALETSQGERVGSVAPSFYDDREVVVIRVVDAPPGMHYRCQFVADDGARHDAGEWTVPESGRAIWIAQLPEGGAERIELVTDEDRVWSAAALGG